MKNVQKNGEAHVNNVTIFPFSRSIFLLGSMRAHDEQSYYFEVQIEVHERDG